MTDANIEEQQSKAGLLEDAPVLLLRTEQLSASHGIELKKPPQGWPIEGSLSLNKGGKEVEIIIKSPTGLQKDSPYWGIALRGSALGKDWPFYRRESGGWTILRTRRTGPFWEPVSLVDSIGFYLLEYFEIACEVR